MQDAYFEIWTHIFHHFVNPVMQAAYFELRIYSFIILLIFVWAGMQAAYFEIWTRSFYHYPSLLTNFLNVI